ncbi:MAG: hypothetical protein JWN25_1464 [Verrucomicrobiales bacterium]|nr:hypothetical protein [Verrucomicrobiales bacterium]
MRCGFRFFFLIIHATVLHAVELDERWWPIQKVPKSLVRTPVSNLSTDMMVQSIAGLAAQAVNDGAGDEMVWVDNGNPDMQDWKVRWLGKHPEVTASNSIPAWELVKRFAERGIIKGYILYRVDNSKGDLNAHRAGMDFSVNVATSMAGILGGILVDEGLEQEAKVHGLRQLMDARDKTQEWCFRNYRDQFNRKLLCTQDPKKPHVRDLAIAQKAFTVFGPGEPVASAMIWLEPLSPILGWNGGDEFLSTDLSSRYGHIQTATDWCMNLPVLMAGSEKWESSKITAFNPASIDWNDKRSAVSFVETDGDNVQWYEGNFFRSDSSYWSNPQRGRIPFGWSSCFAQLEQLYPQAIDYAVSTASTNDSFIEWGGGYYYPDRFARDRKDRWELLGRQAARTWRLMKKSNTRIIGFNVMKFDSPDALKSYEVFAGQTDGLLGILVFQYAPYEAGGGKIFWVKDRGGIEIPVVTARYSIWENSNKRMQAGTPAKVAREIVNTENTVRKEVPHYDWVICHAWSYFKKAAGGDENAENMEQATASANDGMRGYAPVTWCADRLPPSVRVVRPEELLWRIRMRHNADQTLPFIK